jgi:hypothetical protein
MFQLADGWQYEEGNAQITSDFSQSSVRTWDHEKQQYEARFATPFQMVLEARRLGKSFRKNTDYRNPHGSPFKTLSPVGPRFFSKFPPMMVGTDTLPKDTGSNLLKSSQARPNFLEIATWFCRVRLVRTRNGIPANVTKPFGRILRNGTSHLETIWKP